MIFPFKNLIFCFLNVFLSFLFYLSLFSIFSIFFVFVVKAILLLILLFLSTILSLFIFDAWSPAYVYLELLSNVNISFFELAIRFFKIVIIFFFDLFSFLKFFFINFFNFKNFLGAFFQFYQLLNELFYESIYMFVEQTEEHIMVEEANWMPQYLLGDSLEFSLRINKIFNLFSLSDILNEKIFVYRRVGILNSRFWLFRSYTYMHQTEFRVLTDIGTFVEPTRWFLNFRDFELSHYLDPWHVFSNKEIFRQGLPFRKKQYISVELMHNYHSIMESDQYTHYERSYFDYHASTFLFFEYFVIFAVLSIFLSMVDEHLQLDLMSDFEDEEVPDVGYIEDVSHPYYHIGVDENVESAMFSEYTLDVDDYVTDDDLSWDFVLAQPMTNRMHVPSDFDEFELMKELNMLLNEFRTFSFLFPIYKLVYKLSLYRFFDLFLFTDSGKALKIVFKLVLYLPIGFLILSFKILIIFFDQVLKLSFFLKTIIFILIILVFIVYF
jgi:hypothetical protein